MVDENRSETIGALFKESCATKQAADKLRWSCQELLKAADAYGKAYVLSGDEWCDDQAKLTKGLWERQSKEAIQTMAKSDSLLAQWEELKGEFDGCE